MTREVDRTNQEWRTILRPEEFHVLREAGTEPAFSGELLDEKRPGMFTCRACGAELFRSGTKFESGSGWPSFWEAVDPDAVELRADNSLFMRRTEVVCRPCGSHLGHVFDDAPQTPTGNRYCINSLSLGFVPGQDEDSA